MFGVPVQVSMPEAAADGWFGVQVKPTLLAVSEPIVDPPGTVRTAVTESEPVGMVLSLIICR
jgi:hypothetical protein